MPERIELTVNIDVGVRSVNDVVTLVAAALNTHMLDFRPAVAFVRPLRPMYEDTAILIEYHMCQPGGMFFMNDEARIGWYCIRSTDPEKQELHLPPYIFHKCFRFFNGAEYKRGEFEPVQEIA